MAVHAGAYPWPVFPSTGERIEIRRTSAGLVVLSHRRDGTTVVLWKAAR